MLERVNHIIPDFLLRPKYRFLRHIVIQLVVLLITVNVLWDEPDKILLERLRSWVAYFLQINMVLFGNMYILVPRFLIKGKALYYLLLLPLLILFAVFSIGLLQDTSSSNDISGGLNFLSMMSSFAAFLVFMIGLTAIQLFKYHLGNSQKISELENATMAIELANLQNQINPHFLFNTLNNANILVEEDPEKSSYILKKFNDLLRYQTEGEAKGEVCLADDIAFLNDYLNIEKTRRDRFCYTITTEGDCNFNIPPLLFIPFVENAIKHNPENDSYVNLVFKIVGNVLHFECENPKTKLSHMKKEGGIGLVNIRKRLDLLFKNDYSLDLYDEKEKYLVVMELKI